MPTKYIWHIRNVHGITDSMDVSLIKLGDGKGQGSLACCQSMGLQRAGHDLATEEEKQMLRKNVEVVNK